jgi:hypothetical protein
VVNFPDPEEMAQQKADREALAIAQALEESLDTHTKALAEVSRWKAKVAKWAIAAAIVALLAFCAVGFAIYRIHDSQLAACDIGNRGRAGNIQLWDHVLSISKPPPNETPAQKAERLKTVKQFKVYVHHVFKPVDCGKLYGSWASWLH